MKKFIEWLKSPKSDIFLFLTAILLLNLVCSKAFFRLDLTAPKSYSLSQSSRQIVKNLEQPLSIKVFFTKNLPAPYNTIDQYIRDLLVEYKGAANSNFSAEFFDMDKEENQKIARNYGISQVQIQELKNNEVGFKQVWMALTVSYADRTEIIDGLSSADGLEYTLTTTMSRLISTTSALAGLQGKAKLTLYLTKKLEQFNINGLKNLEKTVSAAYKSVNSKNMDRIEFETIDPSEQEIPELVEKYGIQSLSWQDADGEKTGVIGLVLEYGQEFRLLNVKMSRSFFGNIISGTDNLEDELNENLKSLVSKPNIIGYVTGHRELDYKNAQSQANAAVFNSIISDRYEFKDLNLKDDEIPSGIKSVVINGAKEKFEEIELYKLDQFLLRGGNLIIFDDQFEEVYPQGQNAYYQIPQYKPVDNGLETILSKYGISVGKDYVMDENCYVNQDQRSGSTPLYFAPVLQKSNLAKNSPITKNLGYVIMLQNSSINAENAQKNADAKVTILASSSKNSWLVKDNVTAIPQMIRKPTDKSAMQSQNLAVLVEGKFKSAFEKNPVENQNGEFNFTDHYAKSVQNGKIFVIGSSKITTGQVMDESGKQPVAMFVRNVIDYMNGEIDLCSMRTKGLSLNTLKIKKGISADIAKYFNEFGLVILVALCGLAVLAKTTAKKRAIREKYNPDDKREIKTEETK
ncbi:Gldg family protein [uncultured Treponema sp.]|uniref:GldG family protein n=1 Tax=uncultured Treponema sp. TaxID=162155 RepID=UPI0025EF5F0E|nr:Gldg family protein [uncultured Treponema sp.]